MFPDPLADAVNETEPPEHAVWLVGFVRTVGGVQLPTHAPLPFTCMTMSMFGSR